MSLWRGLVQPLRWACLAAGALPVLAFPAPNLEFLAWMGLVPGLALMRAALSAREAAIRGWWFGTGFMLAAHYWLAPNIGPGLLAASVLFGAGWAGVAVSTCLLLRPPVTLGRSLAALVVVPSYWVVIEWIRSLQWFGGPWALLGTSQWRHPSVLALAAAGGVWLVSFAIVAVNTGLLIALTAPRPALRGIGLAAAAVVLAAGPVLFSLTPAPRAVRAVTLALVQPGITAPALRTDASERLTRGLRHGQADLVVWGESSVAADLGRDPGLLGRIEALSVAVGAQILVNQDSYLQGRKSKVAVLVGPDSIAGSYTKSRLVPFGEYIPFRGQLGWLTRISRAARVNMLAGPGARVLTVTPSRGGPLRVGVLICFESAFPDMSRADARHGAAVIVYQTSDSTFQQSWAPAQHASLGAVRAAETGRPVVQAALTGDSVAFDARGRTLAWLPSSRSGVVLVRLGVMPRTEVTPFDRFGEVVPWTAVAIAILAACIVLFIYRRPHRPAPIMLEGNYRAASSVYRAEPSPRRDHAPSPPKPESGAT